MRHAIATKPIGRVKIRLTKQDLTITLPSSENMEKTKAVTGACFGLTAWIIGGITAAKEFLAGLSNGHIDWLLGIWLCGWVLSAGPLAAVLIGPILASLSLSGRKIVIAGMDVRVHDIGLGFYDLARMTSLRLAPKNVTQGRIQFDYGTRTFSCGKDLAVVEAEQLIQHLTAMQMFRWHIVKCIVFGRPEPSIQEAPTILHNPDVTDLTFPFVRLQELMIDAATHDFQQVERFLTYAVNYIGQEYLKEQVEVHISGDPEQVQPNLRNNFENLCKHVHCHQ